MKDIGSSHWSCSLALDSNDNPHISYLHPLYGWLKYAFYEGGWKIEYVGDSSNYTSLALNSADNPYISYDYGYELKYARYGWSLNPPQKFWLRSTVISSSSKIGEYNSIALDSSNNPHISYYHRFDDGGSLLYSHYYDGSWHYKDIDSGGDVGQYTSLALDSSENPHISYYDAGNRELKYSYFDGVWHTELVDDSSGDVGQYTSLALDSNDNPHISYYDYTNSVLKYAHKSQAPSSTSTSTASSTTTSVPQSCQADADCDNGIFCDGEEKCINDICESGQNPCSTDQACKENKQECWTISTITANSLQKAMTKPLLRATKNKWLITYCAEVNHFDGLTSKIEVMGVADGFHGVTINGQKKAFSLGKFIFVPVSITKEATAGNWMVIITTELPNFKSEEQIVTDLQLR